MRSLKTAAAITAALALTLSACGDDYDADLVDALKAQGASQEEAECFIDEIGEDDAQGFLDNIDADSAPENADKIIAALDECGVAPDGGDAGEEPEITPEEPETSATEEEGGDEGAGDGGATLGSIAACLEDEGLNVTLADGPPARIDIIGTVGTGGIVEYGDADAAANASDQFVDAFGGGEKDFLTGSSGNIAYYYQLSNDEGSLVEGCLA